MFVIINTIRLEASTEFPSLGQECIIPVERRPSFIHETRDQAEAELLRLSQQHPGGRFVLFEATHTARETTALVPTKVWALEIINN